MAVPFAACMALVASLYGLPPRVLASIQDVEGGRAGLASRNRDGTDDLGVMQVNTAWLPALATYTNLPAATVRDRLLTDPCFNIGAAGAILRRELDEAGGDLIRAVGTYHSHTPNLRDRYQGRVVAAARRLFWAAPKPHAGMVAGALRTATSAAVEPFPAVSRALGFPALRGALDP